MYCDRNLFLLFISSMPQTIFNRQALDLVLEEWKSLLIPLWKNGPMMLCKSFYKTPVYISDWYLGLLSPTSSCALDIVEGKNHFSFRVIWYSWYQRDDDHVVTVSKYLQHMPVKESCVSGNVSYVNYSMQKAASVSPSAERISCARTRQNWALLRFLSRCLPKPAGQGALAVIKKGTWQAGGQNRLSPLMVSIRFKWLEIPQLLFHVKGVHGGGKER